MSLVCDITYILLPIYHSSYIIRLSWIECRFYTYFLFHFNYI